MTLAFTSDPSYSAKAYIKTFEVMQAHQLKRLDPRWPGGGEAGSAQRDRRAYSHKAVRRLVAVVAWCGS
jgi:hypothetical protein